MTVDLQPIIISFYERSILDLACLKILFIHLFE